MTDREARRSQLANAAAQIDVDTLREAASRSPGGLGATLRGVADALSSPDPGAALARLFEQDPTLREDLPRDIRRGVEAARGAILAHKLKLSAMRAQSERLATHRERLLASLREALALVEADPELGALAREALLLGEHLPSDDELRATFVELETTLEQLNASLSAIGVDAPAPAVVAPLVEGLESRLAELVDKADPGPAVDLLVRLASLTLTRKSPGSAAVCAVAASAVSTLQGPTHPSAQRLWRQALDAAVQQRDGGRAWVAGKHVQAEGVLRADWALVALVAHQVADLHPEESERAQLARLEEALALSRISKHREMAGRIATHVLNGAKRAPAAHQARLWLMAAQVSELLGEDTEAIHRLRAALEHSQGGPADVMGRAALHLGRLEAAAGHKHQAHQALELAWRVAGTTGDWGLFSAAAPAWIEHLRGLGEVDAAREALQRAVTLIDTTPYGAEFRAEAQRRWGAELT